MWTAENRARYDRSALRYPSDLTEAELALIGPLIPPAKRGGNKRTVDVRAVANGILYVLGTGCQWAEAAKVPPAKQVECRRREPCPKTCRRAARYGTTSGAGTTTARWSASTTRFTSSAASGPGVRPARVRRSSTARA